MLTANIGYQDIFEMFAIHYIQLQYY